MLFLTEAVEVSQKKSLTDISQIVTIDDLILSGMESKVTKVVVESSVKGRFFFIAVADVEECLT